MQENVVEPIMMYCGASVLDIRSNCGKKREEINFQLEHYRGDVILAKKVINKAKKT